jgi:amino acid adenylation domain-containing protein
MGEVQDAAGVRRAPLTGIQRRLWFLNRIEPENLEYVQPVGYVLRGPLDVDALGRALAAFVDRHEALRTRFETVDGEPVQVVEEDAGFALRVLEPDGGDVRARVTEELIHPFDLSRLPLLRAVVVPTGPGEHVFAVAFHHIVFDGWSLGIMGTELPELYRAFAAGERPSLPPPVQYAAFAEREPAAGELESVRLGLDYWRGQLAGVRPLDLPADRPRPPRRSGRGAEHFFIFPDALFAAVGAACRQLRVTPYMLLLSAWAALLHRRGGATDIGFGTPVAGRALAEFQGTFGLFLNTFVVRLDLSGDPTFEELAARTRSVVTQALRHHDVPFDQVVQAVNPPRDLSRTPLFQVLFGFLDLSARTLALPGVEVHGWKLGGAGAQADLDLQVIQQGGYFGCRLIYSLDLYDADTVERLARHFLTLLEDALERPGRRLSELRVLPADERTLLVRTWNQTRATYPRECLHDLVAGVAAASPGAVAVESDAGRLTYAELDARANQLAHELLARGLGPEGRVGVCLERTPDLAVALLGVLRAGGAYVPLDAAYPAERTAYMLHDSGAAILVTGPGAATGAPFEGSTVDVRRDRALLDGRPASAPAVRSHPERLAYVIYTSGSTGRPKGVEIPHRALVNLLASVREAFGVTADDVVLATTSLSFDIAGIELYLPLLGGGRLALAPTDCVASPAAMAAAVERFRPTLLQGTPTTLRLLAQSSWPGAPGLVALSIGEVLPPAVAAGILERGVGLWNLYGPTETTIYSTGERLERGMEVTIGRPLANQTCYVLDRRLQPVPIGVPGRLHVGGAGVARGYHGRAALTAERFLPDPFGAGGRIYDTGDEARFRADGRLEFIGRADNQVKLRGVRIELGEIEHRLAAHEAVAAAAVVLREERLVAYVCARGEAPPAADLRRWLRDRLLDAMVPSDFVFLAELPRTPNGKVDRRALPEPEAPRADPTDVPASEAETALAEIWREVLELREIGRYDDFFDLGGHSLAALQVLELVRERFGVDLPPDSIFDAPTLEELAALLA